MADPALALQKALVAAFKGATEADQSVFDSVPAGAPFPRITLGSGQALGRYADCYDGSESILQIDVWNRPKADGSGLGMAAVKRIASVLRDIVNAGDFALDGHTLELAQIQSATYSTDPDEMTTRATLSARFLTQPAD